MAHKKNNTNLTELLLQCMTQPDPMLSMLEWLCTRLMEAEVDQQLGAEKSQRTDGSTPFRPEFLPLPQPDKLLCCQIFSQSCLISHKSLSLCL